MNNQIIIYWGTGKGIFYLPEFFPCAQAKLKKFVKLMRTDPMSKDDNINTCINHINDRIDNTIEEMKEISRHYANTRTEKYEAEERIKSRKKSNGVPLTKEEIEKTKRTLYFVRRKAKELEREFHELERMKNKLHKNLELLKKLCDVS